jgi:hypothetical protein
MGIAKNGVILTSTSTIKNYLIVKNLTRFLGCDLCAFVMRISVTFLASQRRSQLQVVLLLSWQFAAAAAASWKLRVALSGGGGPCHSQVPPAQIAVATRRVVNYCARALFIKEQVEAQRPGCGGGLWGCNLDLQGCGS